MYEEHNQIQLKKTTTNNWRLHFQKWELLQRINHTLI